MENGLAHHAPRVRLKEALMSAPTHPSAAFSWRGPSALLAPMVLALIAFAVALAVLGWMAIWGVRQASVGLIKAEHSFHQLENARAIEAAFNRYLLREIVRRIDGPGNVRESLEAARLRGELHAYRLTIASEIGAAGSEAERQAEREELIQVNKLAALFETMETESFQDRIVPSSFEAVEHARAFLSRTVNARDEPFRAILFDINQDESLEAQEAFQSLERLRDNLLLLGGGLSLALLAGAFVYGWMFYRRLLSPIRRLTIAAEGFRGGETGVRAPSNLPREFAVLASRFNSMAERIETEHSRLATEVALRTTDLETANQELQKIDQSRRRFFANVSHELRTPTTVLLGEAQVALRRRDCAEIMAAALERIAASGAFLRRRLDDLMKLARSEDGQLTLTFAAMDFAEAARDAVKIATAYAEANEVRLEVDIDGDVEIEGDAEALRQAALVLIDNAVKFSPIGSAVKVRATIQTERVLLSVSDVGPGFETDTPEKLFDRYAQESTGRGRGGSGLGLAIAHWIVQQHNGAMRAWNAEQGGAIVEMELPR